MMCIGIVGTYVGNIFMQVKGKTVIYCKDSA